MQITSDTSDVQNNSSKEHVSSAAAGQQNEIVMDRQTMEKWFLCVIPTIKATQQLSWCILIDHFPK